MSPGKKNPDSVKIAVITVSPSKTLSEDHIGIWIRKQAKKYGYEGIIHQVVTNHIPSIREIVSHVAKKVAPQAIIVSGGTGLSVTDVTIEALAPMFTKELSSFGPILANMIFEQKDSAAITTRAAAGIIDKSVVFCIPDTLDMCRLACNELIFPELGNISKCMEE